MQEAAADDPYSAVQLPSVHPSNISLDAEDSNDELNESTPMGFRPFGVSNVGGAGSSGQGGGQSSSSCVWDPNERVRNALAALKIMCESSALEPHLHQLLGER